MALRKISKWSAGAKVARQALGSAASGWMWSCGWRPDGFEALPGSAEICLEKLDELARAQSRALPFARSHGSGTDEASLALLALARIGTARDWDALEFEFAKRFSRGLGESLFWAAMDFCRDGGNEEAFYRLIRLGSLGSGAGSKAPLEGLRRLGRKSLSDPAGSEALCRLFARIGARSPWAEAAELLLDSGAGMAQAGFELAGRGLLGDEKESWNTALELFRMDPRVGAEEAALTDLAARKGLCDWWGKAGVAGYCCGAVGEALRLPERLVAWRKDGESLASRASKRRNWWFVLWLLEGGWDCESDGRDGLELWRRAEFSAGSDPGARACLDLARASLARKECEGLLEATGRGRDGRKSGRL